MRLLGALFAFGVLAVTAGCSSSSPSAPATSSKPAVCTSVEQLKASVTKLANLDISVNVFTTLRTDLNLVKQDLQTVSQDAKSQYSGAVAKVRAAASDVRAAATAAQRNPNASTLSALVTAVKSLASDVNALSNEVASTC